MARHSKKRADEIAEILRAIAPQIPWADADPVRQAANQRNYQNFPPSIAVWLCLVAHARHQHTAYDQLMDDGLDRDAARFMVLDDLNDCLASWGVSRQVSLEDS